MLKMNFSKEKRNSICVNDVPNGRVLQNIL